MDMPNSTRHLYVISDLHISAGPLDDCDEGLERQLVAFVTMLAAQNRDTELVINGDFLDFVQAPPWEGPELEDTTASGIDLCFTEAQSVAKFDAIYSAHRSIFGALGSLLCARDGNQVTILPGNHDVDFFWPAVQAQLTEAVCGGSEEARGRFQIYLERVYRPVGHLGVWIEHGHQADPINRFFLGDAEVWSPANPPIEKDRFHVPRLLSCLGTRFLIRFLNRVDAEYPFVDNVKPFSRFLKIFLWSGLTLPFRFAGCFARAITYLAVLRTTNKEDFLSSELPNPTKELAPRVKRIVERQERRNDQRLWRDLQAAGFESARGFRAILDNPAETARLIEFLCLHPEIVENNEPLPDPRFLSIDGGHEMLSLEKGFHIDESQLLYDEAARILTSHPDVQLVLMGHTHETQIRPKRLPYINTGCWTRYYRFSAEEKTRSATILKTGAERDFPYLLQYAHVAGNDAAGATLELFAGSEHA